MERELGFPFYFIFLSRWYNTTITATTSKAVQIIGCSFDLMLGLK
jgi:hypothetical protein